MISFEMQVRIERQELSLRTTVKDEHLKCKVDMKVINERQK